MGQMTPGAARGIDPILTTVAQGYENATLIGMSLFPQVSTQQRGGKILSFGKEAFTLYGTSRAPGTKTNRIQLAYSTMSYALVDKSLEAAVPFELQQEANAVPGINLASASVFATQSSLALELEVAQANLATTAANYQAANKNTSLTGTSLWSDATNSDPIGNVEAAKDAIRAAVGRRPNLMIVGPKVLTALRVHSKVVDRLKYTTRDVATPEMLAMLFGVDKVLLGDAIYADSSGTFQDVWGKNAVLGFTEVGGAVELGTPTFGYTYRLSGYPYVELPYQDRNAKSWIYPVTDAYQPAIVSASGGAGFLISPAVA